MSERLRILVERHLLLTGSQRARELLEDWDHALAIYDALGPEAFEWQRIAGFLNHQPAMRKRMAALNRACAGS